MKKRFILDMTMLFVFLIVVGYKPLGNYWHETLGMVLFVLVFLHNYWNRQWYKSLKKGSWGLERKYTAAVDGLLIVSFLAVLLTAPFISRSYSLGFNIHFLEGIHKAGGALMLAAIGLHLGIHWSALLPRFKKALHLGNKKTVSIFLKVLAVVLAAAGIYFSFGFHIGNRIFLLPVTGTRMRAPNVPAFVLAHLTIAILYAEISYYIQKFIKSSGRKPRAVKK